MIGLEFACGRHKILFGLLAGADSFLELEPQLRLQFRGKPRAGAFSGILGSFFEFFDFGVQTAALHSPLVARAFEFLLESPMLPL